MNANSDADLHLGTDFAARVLEAADRVVTRRRRHRRMAGASVLCAAIAVVAVWLDLSAAPQNQGRSPNLVFAANGAAVSSRDGSPDALAWLFPDAEPLSRYAAEDTPDDSGASAGALFTDDD